MLLHLLLLAALSYFIFVLTSNLMNPFEAPSAPLIKRRFHFGRAAAIASIVAGILAVAALNLSGVSERIALSVYLCVGLALMVPNFIKFRGSFSWR